MLIAHPHKSTGGLPAWVVSPQPRTLSYHRRGSYFKPALYPRPAWLSTIRHPPPESEAELATKDTMSKVAAMRLRPAESFRAQNQTLPD